MGLESIQVGGAEACGQEECAPHSSEERVTLGQIGAGIGGQMAGRGGGAPSSGPENFTPKDSPSRWGN